MVITGNQLQETKTDFPEQILKFFSLVKMHKGIENNGYILGLLWELGDKVVKCRFEKVVVFHI